MLNSAFLILDLQNDLCHKDGVFQNSGLDVANANKIISSVSNMICFCKENNIPILGTQLSILENSKNEPMGLGLLKKNVPFIENEGLRIGSWGHDLLDEVKNVDFLIKRWSVSSFYHTELAKYLSALRVNHLLIGGFTTNGIVETTTREAAGRNYKITVFNDCTASYSESLHFASLTNLSNFGEVISSKNWIENFLKQ